MDIQCMQQLQHCTVTCMSIIFVIQTCDMCTKNRALDLFYRVYNMQKCSEPRHAVLNIHMYIYIHIIHIHIAKSSNYSIQVCST